MTKISPLTDVVNLQNESTAVATINSNYGKIEAAFNNTLSLDGSSPNAMLASLDMNGQKILNLGTATASGDVVNKGYVDALVGGLTPEVIAGLGDIPQLVEDAEAAADAAAQSAIDAAGYVGAATSAPMWTTGRTITTTGDVTGVSAAWDGSANISFGLTIANGAVTAGKLASGVAISNIGYTPLNTAGGTLAGQVINGHVPTTTLDKHALGFRGIPVIIKDTDWLFQLDDCGKMLRHGSVTGHIWGIGNLSDLAYPDGFSVLIRNVGTGSVLLYRGAGVALYKDGSPVNADVSVAQWGKALLIHEGSNIWTVGGTGIS